MHSFPFSAASTAAILALVLSGWPASGDTPPAGSADAGSSHPVRLELTQAEVPDAGLVVALTGWIAAVSDLRLPEVRPAVRIAAPETLASLYARQGNPEQPVHLPAGPTAIEALYDTRDGTIFLPQAWRPSPAGVSVLVHELVHHMQAQGGRGYACPAAREAEAYAAQALWLAEFGLTLETEFGINRMTLFVLTNCGM